MRFELKDVKYIFENSLKLIVGCFLIVLGVIGLFLPFVQGVVLILLGLVILGGKKMREKIAIIRDWLRRKIN